eukprot:CAMPEP_0113953756 /NCGR_PEP_ID=MMETSP0011_2-20120614/20_1 /TAXON_ID=101924 /ORGANISM="Rhodosorus marinus" /LENGTH=124 /DNA_ID=CAMNT_0000962501 /DNA_START=144 /DNA_END=518 /DNA_ORIENTATION=+ /assembly_acc=CAM_ASM_000156
MTKTKAELEKVIAEVRDMQKDVGKITNQHVNLNSQLTENRLVEQELALLKDDAEVFKLIGPVLIKQDILEAKGNVSKRINFITSEMKRTDDQMALLEKKQEAKRTQIMDLQVKLQELAKQGAVQ